VQQRDVLGVEIEIAHSDGDHDELVKALKGVAVAEVGEQPGDPLKAHLAAVLLILLVARRT
jgi:hypothetical protein